MAEKPKTKKTAKPRTKKEKATPGIGHNYRVDRRVAKEFFDKLDKLHAQKAESNAGYMADINVQYEKASNALGIPEKLVKKVFKQHRAALSAQAEYAELESDERDQYDALMLAHEFFKSSPLGKAAIDRKERDGITAEMAPDDNSDGDDAFAEG